MSVKLFREKSFYFGKNDEKKPYREKVSRDLNVINWGQMKLFLNELLFLVQFHKPSDKKKIVVYAGAAPGIHIPLLSSFFPDLEFHLYDMREFAEIANNNKNIKIFTGDVEGKFTNEVARKYKNKNIIFISDIRRSGYPDQVLSEYKGNKKEAEDFIYRLERGFFKEGDKQKKDKISSVLEKSIIEDHYFQSEWVKIIDPEFAMLKFRLPFPVEGDDSTEKFLYLKGIVYRQPYQRIHSTECRLVPIKENGFYPEVVWDNTTQEQLSFFHNTETRPSIYYDIFGIKRFDKDNEFILNYDSMFELYTYYEYLKRFPSNKNLNEFDLGEKVYKISAKVIQFFEENVVGGIVGRKNRRNFLVSKQEKIKKERERLVTGKKKTEEKLTLDLSDIEALPQTIFQKEVIVAIPKFKEIKWE